eukprot:2147299-Rhodomonas_salina.2
MRIHHVRPEHSKANCVGPLPDTCAPSPRSAATALASARRRCSFARPRTAPRHPTRPSLCALDLCGSADP